MGIRIDTKVKCDVPGCQTPEGEGSVSVPKFGPVTGPGDLPLGWVWGGNNNAWVLCPNHAKGPGKDAFGNPTWD
jgi:hypothetical protein